MEEEAKSEGILLLAVSINKIARQAKRKKEKEQEEKRQEKKCP